MSVVLLLLVLLAPTPPRYLPGGDRYTGFRYATGEQVWFYFSSHPEDATPATVVERFRLEKDRRQNTYRVQMDWTGPGVYSVPERYLHPNRPQEGK